MTINYVVFFHDATPRMFAGIISRVCPLPIKIQMMHKIAVLYRREGREFSVIKASYFAYTLLCLSCQVEELDCICFDSEL